MSNENFTAKTVLAAIQSGDRLAATRFIQRCNDAYYGEGDSPLTDAEFDSCMSAFAAKFGEKIRTAPSHRRTDRHATIDHHWPLLSGYLAKAESRDALTEWLGKRLRQDVENKLVCSPKWDGMSIVVTYSRHGEVWFALTRGDGGKGVDVSRMLKGEKHFGQSFDAGHEFGVKYEVMISWTALERLNSELGKGMKNPRNSVAGIVGSDKSAARRKYVTLVPLDITWVDCKLDRMERLQYMSDLFCDRVSESGKVEAKAPFVGNPGQETPFLFWETDRIESILSTYDDVHSWRESEDCDYMIDGTVIEFVGNEDIERLGGLTSDCPDYTIAAKFPSMVGRSRVIGIDFDLGNTGRLTPVVNYEPILMDGRTFSRTSISNFTRFDELKLCVGTPIVVDIRGDVLGYVNRDGPDPAGSTPIEFALPSGGYFTHNEKGQRVFAYVAAPLAGRCERMMVKCGVKGVRIETIQKLVDAGVVKQLSDMWRLEQQIERIAQIPGLGQASAEQMVEAIEQKRSSGVWDWEILASVGINSVGRSLSKEVLRLYKLKELLGELPDDLSEGDPLRHIESNIRATIGPERCQMVLGGIDEFAEDIRSLVEAVGNVRVTRDAASKSTAAEKYKVVVTGDLVNWGREQFRDYIESLGHKMVGSISSKTDFLVTNTPGSGTVKNKKAQELGVRIITEDEAIEILGLTVPEPKAATSSEPGAQSVSLEEM